MTEFAKKNFLHGYEICVRVKNLSTNKVFWSITWCIIFSVHIYKTNMLFLMQILDKKLHIFFYSLWDVGIFVMIDFDMIVRHIFVFPSSELFIEE